MTFFFQNVVNALQWGSFYALIALGYSMVYGILMLFNFAHGDIFMVGAYIGFGVATAIIALTSSGVIILPHWLILVLTILISMFLTSFVGMLVERIGYRPLRDAPRASAAIRVDDRHNPGDWKPASSGCATSQVSVIDTLYHV